MLYYLLLPFNLVSDFINLGGPVLLVLFFVAAYMWVLISERIFFFTRNSNDPNECPDDDVDLFGIGDIAEEEAVLEMYKEALGM